MKNSSYVTISLFSIVLGIAILFPQMSLHRAVVSIPPTEPQITLEIAPASSAQAATTSVLILPEISQSVAIPQTAANVTSVPVQKTIAAVAIREQPQLEKKDIVAKPLAMPLSSYRPTELVIPTLAFRAPVKPVTINEKGEMDVPDGKTNNVGWYAPGVVPGNVGSAVMDAHVYAAFGELHKVSVGDDLYVQTEDGTRLHFVVVAKKTYALSELRSDLIFYETTGRHLNLVTCAGEPTPDRTTYTHRLVVYTELVD